MAKIYRKSDLLIIEGRKPMPVLGYSYSINNGTVTITNEGDGKGDFNADWSTIRNQSGDTFDNSTELITYLDELFQVEDIKQWVTDNYGEPQFDFEDEFLTLIAF